MTVFSILLARSQVPASPAIIDRGFSEFVYRDVEPSISFLQTLDLLLVAFEIECHFVLIP